MVYCMMPCLFQNKLPLLFFFFFFLPEESVQAIEAKVGETKEACLPDVTPLFLLLLKETVQTGGKEVRSLADANWKSNYPTSWYWGYFLFLLEETVQIGGKEVTSLPDANWKSNYPTSWYWGYFLFLLEETVQIGGKEVTSRPDANWKSNYPTSWYWGYFFIFARGNCANRRKRSEISRRRQLEVQLPDVVVFLFLLEETVQIGGKEVRSLADANWKSVYPTSNQFGFPW